MIFRKILKEYQGKDDELILREYRRAVYKFIELRRLKSPSCAVYEKEMDALYLRELSGVFNSDIIGGLREGLLMYLNDRFSDEKFPKISSYIEESSVAGCQMEYGY